ncbi:MAG: Ribosomal protein L18E [Candidatus Alkanophagales archaeon MCA70_species_2]|nr:Ribosomal protein L18E [Candidatus Alkanophaga liquidiphilum]
MRARERAKARKADLRILRLLEALRKAPRENDARIWRDIAERLERPRKSYAEDGDTVLVLKVLGAGEELAKNNKILRS